MQSLLMSSSKTRRKSYFFKDLLHSVAEWLRFIDDGRNLAPSSRHSRAPWSGERACRITRLTPPLATRGRPGVVRACRTTRFLFVRYKGIS